METQINGHDPKRANEAKPSAKSKRQNGRATPAETVEKQEDHEREKRAVMRLGEIRSCIEENARELAVTYLDATDSVDFSLIGIRQIEWEGGVSSSSADSIQDVAQAVEPLWGVLYGHADYLRGHRGEILTQIAVIRNCDGCQLWQTGTAVAKLLESFGQIFASSKPVHTIKHPDYLIDLASATLPAREIIDQIISMTILLAGEIEAAVKYAKKSLRPEREQEDESGE
jgi:hypothetical protein